MREDGPFLTLPPNFTADTALVADAATFDTERT